jgi:hypothetical protein
MPGFVPSVGGGVHAIHDRDCGYREPGPRSIVTRAGYALEQELPMRPMSCRRWITPLVIAAAFVAGIGVDHIALREAHAQSLSTATIYVPPGGLVFRTPDGSAIARLSRDAHGGIFELFDDQQAVSVRAPSVAAPRPPLAPNPYVIDPGY